MSRMMYVAVSMLALGGCAPTAPRGFESPDPQERSRAGLHAAGQGERSRTPELIDLLENDDAAARLAAIGALRQLTGKEFGYDYLASPSTRSAAIGRWKAWLESDDGRNFSGRTQSGSGK